MLIFVLKNPLLPDGVTSILYGSVLCHDPESRRGLKMKRQVVLAGWGQVTQPGPAAGSNLPGPIGLMIAGPVSDRVGIQAWFLLGGVLCVLMGIVGLFIPAVMNIEEKHKLIPVQIHNQHSIT